jgi:hypothetical protein
MNATRRTAHPRCPASLPQRNDPQVRRGTGTLDTRLKDRLHEQSRDYPEGQVAQAERPRGPRTAALVQELSSTPMSTHVSPTATK